MVGIGIGIAARLYLRSINEGDDIPSHELQHSFTICLVVDNYGVVGGPRRKQTSVVGVLRARVTYGCNIQPKQITTCGITSSLVKRAPTRKTQRTHFLDIVHVGDGDDF